MFSPEVFPFCRLHLVQLAIHFPKLLPQHIYIYAGVHHHVLYNWMPCEDLYASSAQSVSCA